jgi:imidazole glycerol-phosphate synthase subunit HisF
VLKYRLIAVILVRDGRVVQSVKFKHTNVIHSDPIHAIESFNKWAIDEIVVLNVSRDESTKSDFINVIRRISTECFVPLSTGGWVTDTEYAHSILANGADKLVVNTHAFLHPEFISELAQKFGNQCVVVSIDSKKDEKGKEFVTIDRGRKITDIKSSDWAKKAESLGAGEIFINSIDFDGNRKGYNLALIKAITSTASVPVIAMGGVFNWNHLAEGISLAGADAVAAANIFHYTEHSTKKAKKYLLDSGLNFRKI